MIGDDVNPNAPSDENDRVRVPAESVDLAVEFYDY